MAKVNEYNESRSLPLRNERTVRAILFHNDKLTVRQVYLRRSKETVAVFEYAYSDWLYAALKHIWSSFESRYHPYIIDHVHDSERLVVYFDVFFCEPAKAMTDAQLSTCLLFTWHYFRLGYEIADDAVLFLASGDKLIIPTCYLRERRSDKPDLGIYGRIANRNAALLWKGLALRNLLFVRKEMARMLSVSIAYEFDASLQRSRDPTYDSFCEQIALVLNGEMESNEQLAIYLREML